MKHVLMKLRENKVLKVILLIASFGFPFMTIWYFGSPNDAPLGFDFIWIGAYSVVLIWLFYDNIVIKICLTGINTFFFIGLMLFCLMGGAGVIPGMI